MIVVINKWFRYNLMIFTTNFNIILINQFIIYIN